MTSLIMSLVPSANVPATTNATSNAPTAPAFAPTVPAFAPTVPAFSPTLALVPKKPTAHQARQQKMKQARIHQQQQLIQVETLQGLGRPVLDSNVLQLVREQRRLLEEQERQLMLQFQQQTFKQKILDLNADLLARLNF
jgi:hypothetical protein